MTDPTDTADPTPDIYLTAAPDTADLLQAIGDARVRFWVCPIREHRNRNDERGWPVVTVEWRSDVAHCTAPGCGHTSMDTAPRRPKTCPDCGGSVRATPALLDIAGCGNPWHALMTRHPATPDTAEGGQR